MTVPTLSTPPAAPQRGTDLPPDYIIKADAMMTYIQGLPTELTAWIAAVALFVAGVDFNGNSTTSNTVGTGSKSFTADTGKLWQIGQFVIISNTATPANYMAGQVTAYNSGTGALTVNMTVTGGSGTFAAWSIGISPVAALYATLSGAEVLTNKTLSFALNTFVSTLGLANGGTGQASAPASFAALFGYATTATAGATTTLTNASAVNQFFTGILAQTITLPVVSTLALGWTFAITNRSSIALTVNSSGGNLVATVPPNTTYVFDCILITGTTAASWDAGVEGFFSAPAGAAYFLGYTTTATAGGTTTLTAASSQKQVFTGTLNQTITLPVVSTLTLGWRFKISNPSTGTLTVNSSGGNLVASVGPGLTWDFTCQLITGTAAASWEALATGFATTTGSGNNVLATSPTIVTPAITDPVLTGTPTQDIFPITDAAGFAINPRNGSIQTITLGASRTPVAAGWANGDEIQLLIDDGTAFAITWTTVAVTWIGGTAPTLRTTGYTSINLKQVGGVIYGRDDTPSTYSVRDSSSASASSITPDAASFDQYTLTALAVGLTVNAPTGSPTNGQKLMFRIKDNGTTRTLTWNAIFRALGATRPTATVISKTVYVGAIYNATDTKWDVVAVSQEA